MGTLGQSSHIRLSQSAEVDIDSRISALKELLETQHYRPGFDPEISNHRLFFRSFDGTANDRENIASDARRTNPDILESLIDRQAPGINHDYVPGVGTHSAVDQINYAVGTGAVERAEDTYDQFRWQVQEWHREDPSVEVYISTAGFSRGAGSARHFANLVYERGVPTEDANASHELNGYERNGKDPKPIYKTTYDEYIVPPKKANLDTMVLYDSVTAGQTQNLKMGMPPVENLKVLHLTANNELRDQFTLQSIIDREQGVDTRLYEFGLPGSHSDIGGGYNDNWLSARALEIGHVFLRKNGVPLKEISEEHRASPDARGVVHDSDQWMYTTFGDRGVNYAENEDVTTSTDIPNEAVQQNLLGRLEYVDNSYLRVRDALAWARTHPEEAEAAGVLARQAELERELENLSEMRERIFQSPDFSLESMAAYNRQFAARQSEADRRMHDRERAEHEAPLSEGSKAFLDRNDLTEEELLHLAESGSLANYLAYKSVALQQAGFQDSFIGGKEFVAALNDGDLVEAALGIARVGVGVDQVLEARHIDSGFLDVTTSEGVQVGLSAVRFVDHVLQGNEAGALSSGAYFLDDLGDAAGIDALQEMTSAPGVGTGLSALSLYGALEGGDAASIAGAGFGTANLIGDGGLSAALPGTGVPYASYLNAGVNLVDGNVEQSGLSAASGYLIATANPVGVAAGVALSLFGGELFGGETPKAWADFKVNDDGSIGIDIGSNESGGGLEAPISQTAEFLTPVIDNVRSYGVEVKPGYLPRVSIKDGQYYLEGDGGTRVIQDPQGELGRLVEMGMIGNWMEANGIELWSRSGRHQYLGDTDWSHSVRGTGEFAGGGQKQYAPVVIEGKDIVSLHEPALAPVARQLAEVQRTWRVDKSLFAGEGGALLAAGLGAGLVQYSAVAEAIDGQPTPVSLVEDPETAALIADAGGDSVIAAGYGLLEIGDIAASAIAASGEPEVAFASFYSGERAPAHNEPLDDGNFQPVTDPVDASPASRPGDPHGSLPVFAANGETVDTAMAAARIRTLADDDGSTPPSEDNSGSGADRDGGGGSSPGGPTEAAAPGDPANGSAAAAGADPTDTVGGHRHTDSTETPEDDADSTAPVPGADALDMVEDRFLLTSTDRLVANDGDGARFLGLGPARDGQVELDANGDIRFTPPADFAGRTGFSYQSRTTEGGVQTREVEVTVEARNDRPDAVDDFRTGEEDAPLNLNELLANDRDVDAEALTIAAVSQVSAGRVDVDASATFRYTPPADHTGEVQIVYLAEDAAGARSAARATLAIEAGTNDPPVVQSVSLEGGVEEQTFTFHESELLDAARDPEGGALAIDAVNAVAGGTLNWHRPSGEVTFAPDQNFHGRAQVGYTVSDPQGRQSSGTAQIVFENVVDPLTAGNTRAAVNEDEVVVFKPQALLPRLDIDNPDGGDVAIVAARMAAGMPGRVNHLPDGSVQWVPPPEYAGSSAFEVRLSNGTERVVSRVDLEVAAVNDKPTIRSDTLEGAVEDTAFRFQAGELIDNDADAEGDPFSVTALRLVNDAAGSLSFDAASGEAVLSPAPDFFGDARLEYTVTEAGGGRSAAGSATVVVAGRDDPPEVADKTFNLAEDEVVVYSPAALLGAPQDADGEAVSITGVRVADPAQGTAALLASGGVRFTPAAEFAGAAAFEFDYSEGVTTGTAQIALDIAAVDDAPEASPDQLTGAIEDQAFTFDAADLLANDRDAEGAPLALDDVRLVNAGDGALEFDTASGRVTLTPAVEFNGEAALEYSVSAGGLSATGAASVVFAPVDDTAAITDKHFTLQEDETRLFTRDALLDATTDADGESLTITGARLADPDAGSLNLLASGDLRFVPAPEYHGDTAFEVDQSDGVTTQSATVGLTIDAINDAPAGPAHEFTGALEDQAFELDETALLAGVTDAEGDAVSLVSVALATDAAGDLARDPASGRIVYTPAADFFGEAHLDYILRDARGAESVRTASIEVENVDDDFTVSDRAITLDEDETRVFASANLLDAATDADGAALSINDVRMHDPAAGEAVLETTGDVRFAPATEFSGPTAFDFDVTDGVNTHTATANLTVTSINDAPVAAGDRLTGAVEDQAFDFTVADLLSNDSDPEGDAFELSDIRVTDPQAGMLEWDQTNAMLSFTPAADFFGEAPIRYTLTEAASDLTGTGCATIEVRGVDDAPVVSDKDIKNPLFSLDEDQARTFAAQTLLDRSMDADGEALHVNDARLGNGEHGRVEVTAVGGVRFEPAADHTGEAPFEIDVTDGHSTVTATMTPYLWPENDAPRVQTDTAAMDEDAILSVGGASLLANDTDVEDGQEGLRIVGPWAASTGSAYYDAAADTLRYTPADDAFGAAWVDYLVEDSDGAFSVARLDVTINNLDDPVQAVDDALSVDEDRDHVFSAEALTGNDLNPDPEALRIVAVDDTGFSRGRLALTPEGNVDYRAEAEFSGAQTFTYTVADESGNQSSAEARLAVRAVNDAPQVSRSNAQVREDDTLVLDVDELAAGATDIEDDWMQVVAARSARGDVEFDALAGEIRFTPKEDLNTDLNDGPLPVEYLVQDEKGGESWGAVDVDVEPVNDPPEAGDDVLFAWEAGPGGYTNPVATAHLLANDAEVDGEALRIDRVTAGDDGAVVLHGDRIDYRADPGFTGEDRFTYRVTDEVVQVDGELSADTGAVSVNVLDNHTPVAHDFATVADEDTVLRFELNDFMAHVDDEDSTLAELPEDHEIVAVSGARHGDAALNDDGSVSFTPNAHYNSAQHGGAAGFDYVVEDIVGNRAEASTAITYTPVNDDPNAVGDRITQRILEEQAAFIDIDDLLANDFDIDEQAVEFTGLARGANHGSVSVQGGQIRYLGDTDFAGGDGFRYRVADGEGGRDTAAVRLDVTNVNDRPRVEFDSAQADDSGPNTVGGLLNNDSDADGDALRIVNPSQGSVANGGAAIRFTADNRGHDYHTTITYGVTDGQDTVQSRLDVEVLHIDRPPSGLTEIKTDADSVFVAGNDPDTPDPTEAFRGGTLSFAGYSWAAEVGVAPGVGAGQNGIFMDVRNEHGHAVSLPDPNQATLRGTGTFSYTIEVSDGENEALFNGSASVPVSLRNTNFTGAGKPVVIDANRDGLNLLGPEESGAKFDWNDDGADEATGWIAGDGDALLAYDVDGDRRVTESDEISFTGYREGAQTDLEGLRAFDSNEDGLFNAQDEAWARFGLWTDDGDAESEDGELTAIHESDIESLSLTSDEQAFDVNGNTVYGLAEVTHSDGTTGELGDVGFVIRPEGGDSAPSAAAEDAGSKPSGSDPKEDETASSTAGDDKDMNEHEDDGAQADPGAEDDSAPETLSASDDDAGRDASSDAGEAEGTDSESGSGDAGSSPADPDASNVGTDAEDADDADASNDPAVNAGDMDAASDAEDADKVEKVEDDADLGDTEDETSSALEEQDIDSVDDDTDAAATAGEDGAVSDTEPTGDDELALPSDEELDQMAQTDNQHAASRDAVEPVAPVDADAALNDPGNAGPEEDERDETDMAA